MTFLNYMIFVFLGLAIMCALFGLLALLADLLKDTNLVEILFGEDDDCCD